jgi:hypothetical protein
MATSYLSEFTDCVTWRGSNRKADCSLLQQSFLCRRKRVCPAIWRHDGELAAGIGKLELLPTAPFVLQCAHCRFNPYQPVYNTAPKTVRSCFVADRKDERSKYQQFGTVVRTQCVKYILYVNKMHDRLLISSSAFLPICTHKPIVTGR